MNSLSRGSGFSPPIVIESPAVAGAAERLLEQVAALGEPQQVAHPGVGGELRLLRQHLGAAEHDGIRLVGEIEDLLPLGDEDVEQLARRAPPSAGVARAARRSCSGSAAA